MIQNDVSTILAYMLVNSDDIIGNVWFVYTCYCCWYIPVKQSCLHYSLYQHLMDMAYFMQ